MTEEYFFPGDRVVYSRSKTSAVPATIVAKRCMKASGRIYFTVKPDDSAHEVSGVTKSDLTKPAS